MQPMRCSKTPPTPINLYFLFVCYTREEAKDPARMGFPRGIMCKETEIGRRIVESENKSEGRSTKA